MIPENFPIGAVDSGALRTLGAIQGIAAYPLTTSCKVKTASGDSTVWVNLDLYRGGGYEPLWRSANAGAAVPPGSEVALLLNPDLARQDACPWVRVGVIVKGVGERFSGKYFIVSVTHKYGSSGSGYKTTLRQRRP